MKTIGITHRSSGKVASNAMDDLSESVCGDSPQNARRSGTLLINAIAAVAVLATLVLMNGPNNLWGSAPEAGSKPNGIDNARPNRMAQVKRERRRKLHVCWNKQRARNGYIVLTDEFGFEAVNATADDDWDVVFGGYPYCGSKKTDYKMETGLNAKLSEQGWNNLQSHQVWFPCMGCRQSYCNKRELCRLQREIDPTSCYLFPEDRAVFVSQAQKANTSLPWVVKWDGTTSALHANQGVQVVDTIKEVLNKTNTKDGAFLVQPYIEPFLGEGRYKRKSEIRYYVTITSVSPLRVYVHNEPWVPLSTTLHNTKNPSELEKKCMRDSHAFRRACTKVQSPLPKQDVRIRFFGDYVEKAGMPGEMARSLHQEALDMLTDIFERSNSVMEENEINMGIKESGAMCVSFMRADFGISSEGKPFLYEINELPYGSEPHIAGQVQRKAYRDLFTMIGLDQKPLPEDERAKFESEHLGGWIPLPTKV